MDPSIHASPHAFDDTNARNTLVDSFGVGMTLYFLFGGVHPFFSQHQHANWKELLRNNVTSRLCHEWKSLPRRASRLIEWSIKDNQHIRWDMTRIEGELLRLSECRRQSHKAIAAELFAEEIAARCDFIRQHYEWDVERVSASCTIKPGFTVSLFGDETKQEVFCQLEWTNVGDSSFENVRRYIGTAADKAVASLKTGGWRINLKSVMFNGCRIQFGMPIALCCLDGALDNAGKSLNVAITNLRM